MTIYNVECYGFFSIALKLELFRQKTGPNTKNIAQEYPVLFEWPQFN